MAGFDFDEYLHKALDPDFNLHKDKYIDSKINIADQIVRYEVTNNYNPWEMADRLGISIQAYNKLSYGELDQPLEWYQSLADKLEQGD